MAEVAAHQHLHHPGQDASTFTTTANTANISPPQSHPLHVPAATIPAAPHGKKRAGDNSLESEQRLSKRFDLLNLVDKNGTRLYIPVPGSSDSAQTQPPPNPIALPTTTKPPTTRSQRAAPTSSPETAAAAAADASEYMQIDPTPHKLYIHDLSAELSSSPDSSDEETPIFLSDIEKHLSKIPRHILLAGRSNPRAGAAPEPSPDNQVVLYNVPSSLSVPQERDSVRKAIVEARARVRERQACGLVEPERVALAAAAAAGAVNVQPDGRVDAAALDSIPPPQAPGGLVPDTDVDAMDID